jgi:hypothetical protein
VSSRHSGVISNDKAKLLQKALTSHLTVASRYSVLEEIATEESLVINTAMGHNVIDTLHGKNLSLSQEGPNVQNIAIGKAAWNLSDQQETQPIHELSPVVPPRKQKCFKIPTSVNGVIIMSKNDSLLRSHRNTIITKNLPSTRIINSSSRVQHNVIILGGSHLKGCVIKLRSELSAKFKVSDMIRPGAGSEIIVNSSVEDLLNLHLQDVIGLSTGANDVYRNASRLALTHY